jgi:hypothetical protein
MSIVHRVRNARTYTDLAQADTVSFPAIFSPFMY